MRMHVYNYVQNNAKLRNLMAMNNKDTYIQKSDTIIISIYAYNHTCMIICIYAYDYTRMHA